MRRVSLYVSNFFKNAINIPRSRIIGNDVISCRELPCVVNTRLWMS